jgi:hypothetical protein
MSFGMSISTGPGAAGGGDVVGLAGDAGKGIGILHQVVVLHHRHGDAEDVRLLESILAEHPGHGLAGDHDHRHGVHHRGHQAGHGIAGTGAGGHQYGGGLAGGAGVAVGHVDGALLVADEDELHLRLDRLKSVEDGNRRSTGVAENVLDAEVIERFDQGLCAVEFLFAHGKIGVGEGNCGEIAREAMRKWEDFRKTCEKSPSRSLKIAGFRGSEVGGRGNRVKILGGSGSDAFEGVAPESKRSGNVCRF